MKEFINQVRQIKREMYLKKIFNHLKVNMAD